MPRAKISDAFGITVEVEANEASYVDMLAAASVEFERANQVIDQRRVVGGTGFTGQIHQRPTRAARAEEGGEHP